MSLGVDLCEWNPRDTDCPTKPQPLSSEAVRQLSSSLFTYTVFRYFGRRAGDAGAGDKSPAMAVAVAGENNRPKFVQYLNVFQMILSL